MCSITGVHRGLLWLDVTELLKLSSTIIVDIENSYTYKHPKEESVFCSYMYKSGKLGVPFGNRQKLYDILNVHGISLCIDDRRIEPTFDVPKSSRLQLRDYQESAMLEILEHFIDHTELNLAGKPGSGKSFMLSNLLCKLNVKTLIIANQTMLITQLASEIESVTGFKPVLLGKNSSELGDINIATSQFIAKNATLWSKIKTEIGCLVLDEAEALASPSVSKIFSRSPAKFKIFISATFSRSVDERTQALLDFAGTKKVILNATNSIIPSVIYVECPEEFHPPMDKKLYSIYKGKFFARTSIHDKVLEICKYSISKNRQVLIAADIAELQNALRSLLELNGIKSAVLNSDTKTKDRNKVLEAYNTGEYKVLIGFGVLNAGISIPRIQTIIRVSTPSSKEKLEQFIGRGVRWFVGKEGLFVIDLVFQGLGGTQRLSFYKLKSRVEKWKISLTDWWSFKRRLI